MNRYQVRIDGDIMPDSYTFDELLLNDMFECGSIEVKPVGKGKWEDINIYDFPEEDDKSSTGSDFYIGNDGQAYFQNSTSSPKTEKKQDYVIDEFGQVVRNGINQPKSDTAKNNSANTSSRISNTSSESSDIGWKIFFTIIAIIIFIIVTCTTGWGSIPAGVVCYVTIRGIWNSDFS